MKVREFTRKDGTTGQNYTPEAKDEFIALAEKPFESPEYLGVRKSDGKPFKSKKYGLQVRTSDNKEIFLSLREGQVKRLVKAGNLTGKKIVFYAYSNAYGNQIGCKAI